VTQAAAHKARAGLCSARALAAADEVTRLVEASAGRPGSIVASRHLAPPEPCRIAPLAIRERRRPVTSTRPAICTKWSVSSFPTVAPMMRHERRHVRAATARLPSRDSHPRDHPFIPSRMHLFVRTPAGVWGPSQDPMVRLHALGRGVRWRRNRRSRTPMTTPWLRLFCPVPKPAACPLLQVWERMDAIGGPILFAVPTAGLRREDGGISLLPLRLRVGFPTPGAVTPSISCPRSPAIHTRPETWQLSALPALQDRWGSNSRICKYPRPASQPALVDGVYPSHRRGGRAGSGCVPALPGRRTGACSRFRNSRQGAARLAIEIERTHDIGVNRQLLWRALATLSRENEGGQVSYRELHEAILESPELRQRAEASPARGRRRRRLPRWALATISILRGIVDPPPQLRGKTLSSPWGLVEVCYPGLRQLKLPGELRGAS
jgi:hypothetical protein